MRAAVITPVAGRREHLRAQEQGLRNNEQAPHQRVIIAMDDEPVDGLRERDILLRIAADDRLPLARARNQGARAALAAGADLLIFLDVDCIPAPRLIQRYLAAVEAVPDDLLCGPVHYLDPPGPVGYDLARLPRRPTGHPARPVPGGDQLLKGGMHTLFWSLSFALSAQQWERIGGFDESYEGYGGEDTDFGQRAKASNVDLTWVGGAWAFHQHHPTNDPPTQHIDDILRNAEIFHRRWGWWPMQGWLDDFEHLGLIRWDAPAQRWQRAQPAPSGCQRVTYQRSSASGAGH
jgi:GT2 family glycosyltransferase